jgi:hypothetical protein
MFFWEGVVTKSYIAGKYGICIETLRNYLRPFEHQLPYFFTTKKTVMPIEHNLIVNFLGEYE